MTWLRAHQALPGFPDPSGGDQYVSYRGVPILHQDGVESSAFTAVPIGAVPHVTRVAVHVPYAEGKPAYEIKKLGGMP